MSNGGTVRAFFALLLGEETRRGLGEALRPLRAEGEPVRWVPEKNLHVTIRFLGDLGPTLRGRIEERAADAAAEARPFRFVTGGPGAFPSLRSPRVLWMGLSEGGDDVAGLARRVDRAIGDLGFDEEKRFHPHITAGRTKRRPSPGFLERFGALAPPPFEEQAASLHLMGSTLTPRGAVYRTLREFPLTGPRPGRAPE